MNGIKSADGGETELEHLLETDLKAGDSVEPQAAITSFTLSSIQAPTSWTRW